MNGWRARLFCVIIISKKGILMDIGKQLLLQAFLILLNAFFAMTEIAVLSLSAPKLHHMAEEGDRTAPRLLKLVEEP